LLATHRFVGLIRELTRVPDRDDPYRVTDYAVKETIRLDGEFAMWKVGKLREDVAGFRVPAELHDNRLHASLKSGCRQRIPLDQVPESAEVLTIRRGREPYSHVAYSPVSSARASAMTSSASRPTPAAISTSPCTSIFRISFSC